MHVPTQREVKESGEPETPRNVINLRDDSGGFSPMTSPITQA